MPEPAPLNPHEAFCRENAAMFVAIRGRTPATRTRAEFPSEGEAVAYATGFGDGRTMIYAVTAAGRDAHLRNA